MQRPRRESVLATVLFTDIVGSSELAAELGDRRWRVLLSRHHALVRRELRRFGGKELDTAGDGFFASFDNPGNAVRCAASLVGAVQDLGIDIRTGLHLGQAEIVGRKLGGVAVHIGARTMAQAGPAEVLVTGGLKDVLPPADFRFEDRGTHTLKGVPGEWHLYRLTSLDKPLPGPLDPDVAAARRAAVEAPSMWRRRYVPVAGVAAVVVAIAVVAIALTGDGTPTTVPTGPTPTGLPRHAVVLLDPRTGEVQATLAIEDPQPPPPSGPGGGRWAGPGPRSVAAGEGSIWITNGGSNSVTRIDPVRRVAHSIPVPGGPVDVTVGEGGVWVVSIEGILTRIDPGTNETTTTDIADTAPIPMGVGVDASGVVYVTALDCQICPINFETSVAKIAPSSGSVTALAVRAFYPASSIIAHDGSLWLTAGPEVWQVDPSTRRVLKAVRVGGMLGDLALEPGGASLWVTTVESGGQVGRADQIDVATGEVIGGQPVGCCPGSMAIGEGYVWVTNSQEGTIQRISLVTGDVAPPITVGRGVNGIAVGQGGVWVTIDQ
jgi:YVTN family beta-propeller protein